MTYPAPLSYRQVDRVTTNSLPDRLHHWDPECSTCAVAATSEWSICGSAVSPRGDTRLHGSVLGE